MGAQILEQANASTEKILANLTPSQLTLASPCASWQVRDVVNHLVGNNFWFAGITRDGVAPDRPDNAGPDETGGDYVAHFGEGSAKAVAGFASAKDDVVDLGFAQMPASVFILMASADQFIHGWDVAKATGQSTALDPDLAGQLLAFYQQAIAPEFRGADGVAAFGPLVSTASTDAVAQLVAFSGRTP